MKYGYGWLAMVLALAACDADTDANDDGNDSGAEQCMVDEPLVVDALSERNCVPASTDYQPLTDAENDAWPACLPDDGAYHLVDATPSSIARVEAFEQIMEALADDSPSADAFTEARTIYSIEEGLESRLVRREDHHYDPVPEADWVEGVDADKQCTVEENVAAYPERCAGPGRIAPILNEAFAAGQTGDGIAAVNKAQVEAALLWFIHLSVYKEANTCLPKGKDCDSSWAYYTGGHDRNGGIGLSRVVQGHSDLAHQRIWDGFTAFRCWRELYPDATTLEELSEDGVMFREMADAQLSEALWYGWALIVRDRLEQLGNSCGDQAEANWAFLQIAGPVLSEQAGRVDANANGSLTSLWSQAEPPAAEDVTAAIATIDSIFGCG